MPKWQAALLAIIGMLGVTLACMVGYFLVQLDRMQDVPDYSAAVEQLVQGDADYAQGKPSIAPILTKQPASQTSFNVILYGIDTRDENTFDNALSDTIMLLNLDTEKKTIKLVSFMRDTLVSIPGHGKNKLNTCYRFGGHALASEVLKSHYGIDVDWYAVVNFWSFADLVDVLGGIDVDVKYEELSAMQDNLQEIYNLDKSEKLERAPRKAGVSHLNGKQAVAYARIRSVGQADFERTSRQRVVISAIINEVSRSNLADVLQMMDVGAKYVRTNISKTDMVRVATAFFQLKNVDIGQFRVPDDDTYSLTSYNNASVISV
ncbi:MAG: LCP family protein, partial [Eubacteriales bacterium]|nr:LCP family protein [Eubacteriales bacterium]